MKAVTAVDFYFFINQIWTINVSKNETAKEEKYEQTNKKKKHDPSFNKP